MFSVASLFVIGIWLTIFFVVFAIKRSIAVLCHGVVFGFLFLPQFTIDLPFLDFNKSVLLAVVTAFSILLLEPTSRPTFRPSVIDLPVIVFCLSGLGASVSNELGVYDGLVSTARLFCIWGLPYFIGRVVFASSDNALTLLRTIILGGLVYVPFCAFEMKMAPVLHPMIYGYTPRLSNDFVHAVRFGMWRPTVFLEMGLQLSLFMGIASVVALWGSVSGRISKVALLPCSAVACILGATTILCVSSGAIGLTAIGWGVVLSSRLNLQRLLLFALLLPTIAYPAYRMTNVGAIQVDDTNANAEFADRLQSLKVRVVSEDHFLEKWTLQPLFGWSPTYFLATIKFAIPDSQWIIILTCYGLVGWLAWSLMLTIAVTPAIFHINEYGGVAHPAVPMGLCILVFWLDCQMNAFPTILYGVLAGASSSRWCATATATATATASPQRALWPPR